MMRNARSKKGETMTRELRVTIRLEEEDYKLLDPGRVGRIIASAGANIADGTTQCIVSEKDGLSYWWRFDEVPFDEVASNS